MIQVKNPYRLIDPFNIPLKEPEARDPNPRPSPRTPKAEQSARRDLPGSLRPSLGLPISSYKVKKKGPK